MFVSSGGRFQRSTSSIKYKKDVENLRHDLVDNAVDNLRPVWYRSKNPDGDVLPNWSHIGLIAEEVVLVEPRLVSFKTLNVSWDENGNRIEEQMQTPEPEGVDYARLSVILLDVVQRQKIAISDLQERVLRLENLQ
jgi:hypothetical protein